MYSFVVMVMFLHIDDCGGLKPVGPNKVFANSFFFTESHFFFPWCLPLKLCCVRQAQRTLREKRRMKMTKTTCKECEAVKPVKKITAK